MENSISAGLNQEYPINSIWFLIIRACLPGDVFKYTAHLHISVMILFKISMVHWHSQYNLSMMKVIYFSIFCNFIDLIKWNHFLCFLNYVNTNPKTSMKELRFQLHWWTRIYHTHDTTLENLLSSSSVFFLLSAALTQVICSGSLQKYTFLPVKQHQSHGFRKNKMSERTCSWRIPSFCTLCVSFNTHQIQKHSKPSIFSRRHD